MKVYIYRVKISILFPINSLDEKCPKTTQAILWCTNTFGRVVYILVAGYFIVAPKENAAAQLQFCIFSICHQRLNWFRPISQWLSA